MDRPVTSFTQRLLVGCTVLVLAVAYLDAAFPDASDAPVAVCPKVEVRLVKRGQRIVQDTITEIPEACR